MLRRYSVTGQTVTILTEDKLASDQIAFVRCKFIFDAHWDSVVYRFAQFQQDDKTIEQLLDENDECPIPQELVSGYFTVSVYGADADGMRATTIPCSDFMNSSGYTENSSPGKELTPDLFEQLIRKINKIIVSGGGTGGGGIGFVDWRYDEECYLHIVDEYGIDVLDPLYVPGLGQIDITDEDLELARTFLEQIESHLNSAVSAKNEAEQHKEAAAKSATEATEMADAARESSENAQANAEAAAQSAQEAAASAETANDSKTVAVEAADQAKAYEEAAALSAAEAEASASEAKEVAANTQQYVDEAKKAAEDTKAFAEAADALKKLGDLQDLSESVGQTELFAKASQGYAEDARAAASEAANAAEDAEMSSQAAEEAAQRAEAAASQSVANVEAAVQEVNDAKDAAIEEVQAESAEMIQSAATALAGAEAAKTASEESAAAAEASASEAAESEENAAMYAEAAQQVAEKNGYFYFEIEDGRLIETRTENVSEDMNFIIEEGRLILEYA